MVFSMPSGPASPTGTASADADEVVTPPPLPWCPPFRAVVPQPTWRWGAHIYDHHRARAAWLAAFASEEAAARAAHDITDRRCPVVTDSTAERPGKGEFAFQEATGSAMSSEAVDMPAGEGAPRSLWRAGRAQPATTWAREHLFKKVLTPSDVGNLNRLVVPKHHAEEHFFSKRSPSMAAGMGALIDFRDGEGKAWRFRYSYCASSRIYIFTKGWRRFVREKGLQAGDTVAFSRSGFAPPFFKQLHIDYYRKKTEKKHDDDDDSASVMAVDSRVVMLFGVDIAR